MLPTPILELYYDYVRSSVGDEGQTIRGNKQQEPQVLAQPCQPPNYNMIYSDRTDLHLGNHKYMPHFYSI